MFDKVVATVLTSYLGKYIANLNRENVRVSLWRGNVELENLTLRQNALRSLELPVLIKHGVIGKLTVCIPWTRLNSESVTVELKDVTIVVHPKKAAAYDAELEAQDAFENKQEQLAVFEALLVEEAKKMMDEARGGGGGDDSTAEAEAVEDSQSAAEEIAKDRSLVERLRGTMLNNVRVTVRNVRVIYEDVVTNPERPIFMTLSLDSATIRTTNAAWDAAFAPLTDRLFFKEACLNGLSARIEMDSPETINAADPSKNPASAVVPPVDLKLRLQQQPIPFDSSIPRWVVVGDATAMDIRLTREQWDGVWRSIRYVREFEQFEAFRRFRPSQPVPGHASEWWLYAFRSVQHVLRERQNRTRFNMTEYLETKRLRAEYAELHKRRLPGDWLLPLTEREKVRYEEIERRLPLWVLTLTRRLAHSRHRLEAEQHVARLAYLKRQEQRQRAASAAADAAAAIAAGGRGGGSWWSLSSWIGTRAPVDLAAPSASAGDAAAAAAATTAEEDAEEAGETERLWGLIDADRWSEEQRRALRAEFGVSEDVEEVPSAVQAMVSSSTTAVTVAVKLASTSIELLGYDGAAFASMSVTDTTVGYSSSASAWKYNITIQRYGVDDCADVAHVARDEEDEDAAAEADRALLEKAATSSAAAVGRAAAAHTRRVPIVTVPGGGHAAISFVYEKLEVKSHATPNHGQDDASAIAAREASGAGFRCVARFRPTQVNLRVPFLQRCVRFWGVSTSLVVSASAKQQAVSSVPPQTSLAMWYERRLPCDYRFTVEGWKLSVIDGSSACIVNIPLLTVVNDVAAEIAVREALLRPINGPTSDDLIENNDKTDGRVSSSVNAARRAARVRRARLARVITEASWSTLWRATLSSLSVDAVFPDFCLSSYASNETPTSTVRILRDLDATAECRFSIVARHWSTPRLAISVSGADGIELDTSRTAMFVLFSVISLVVEFLNNASGRGANTVTAPTANEQERGAGSDAAVNAATGTLVRAVVQGPFPRFLVDNERHTAEFASHSLLCRQLETQTVASRRTIELRRGELVIFHPTRPSMPSAVLQIVPDAFVVEREDEMLCLNVTQGGSDHLIRERYAEAVETLEKWGVAVLASMPQLRAAIDIALIRAVDRDASSSGTPPATSQSVSDMARELDEAFEVLRKCADGIPCMSVVFVLESPDAACRLEEMIRRSAATRASIAASKPQPLDPLGMSVEERSQRWFAFSLMCPSVTWRISDLPHAAMVMTLSGDTRLDFAVMPFDMSLALGARNATLLGREGTPLISTDLADDEPTRPAGKASQAAATATTAKNLSKERDGDGSERGRVFVGFDKCSLPGSVNRTQLRFPEAHVILNDDSVALTELLWDWLGILLMSHLSATQCVGIPWDSPVPTPSVSNTSTVSVTVEGRVRTDMLYDDGPGSANPNGSNHATPCLEIDGRHLVLFWGNSEAENHTTLSMEQPSLVTRFPGCPASVNSNFVSPHIPANQRLMSSGLVSRNATPQLSFSYTVAQKPRGLSQAAWCCSASPTGFKYTHFLSLRVRCVTLTYVQTSLWNILEYFTRGHMVRFGWLAWRPFFTPDAIPPRWPWQDALNVPPAFSHLLLFNDIELVDCYFVLPASRHEKALMTGFCPRATFASLLTHADPPARKDCERWQAAFRHEDEERGSPRDFGSLAYGDVRNGLCMCFESVVIYCARDGEAENAAATGAARTRSRDTSRCTPVGAAADDLTSVLCDGVTLSYTMWGELAGMQKQFADVGAELVIDEMVLHSTTRELAATLDWVCGCFLDPWKDAHYSTPKPVAPKPFPNLARPRTVAAASPAAPPAADHVFYEWRVAVNRAVFHLAAPAGFHECALDVGALTIALSWRVNGAFHSRYSLGALSAWDLHPAATDASGQTNADLSFWETGLMRTQSSLRFTIRGSVPTSSRFRRSEPPTPAVQEPGSEATSVSEFKPQSTWSQGEYGLAGASGNFEMTETVTFASPPAKRGATSCRYRFSSDVKEVATSRQCFIRMAPFPNDARDALDITFGWTGGLDNAVYSDYYVGHVEIDLIYPALASLRDSLLSLSVRNAFAPILKWPRYVPAKRTSEPRRPPPPPPRPAFGTRMTVCCKSVVLTVLADADDWSSAPLARLTLLDTELLRTVQKGSRNGEHLSVSLRTLTCGLFSGHRALVPLILPQNQNEPVLSVNRSARSGLKGALQYLWILPPSDVRRLRQLHRGLTAPSLSALSSLAVYAEERDTAAPGNEAESQNACAAPAADRSEQQHQQTDGATNGHEGEPRTRTADDDEDNDGEGAEDIDFSLCTPCIVITEVDNPFRGVVVNLGQMMIKSTHIERKPEPQASTSTAAISHSDDGAASGVVDREFLISVSNAHIASIHRQGQMLLMPMSAGVRGCRRVNGLTEASLEIGALLINIDKEYYETFLHAVMRFTEQNDTDLVDARLRGTAAPPGPLQPQASSPRLGATGRSHAFSDDAATPLGRHGSAPPVTSGEEPSPASHGKGDEGNALSHDAGGKSTVIDVALSGTKEEQLRVMREQAVKTAQAAARTKLDVRWEQFRFRVHDDTVAVVLSTGLLACDYDGSSNVTTLKATVARFELGVEGHTSILTIADRTAPLTLEATLEPATNTKRVVAGLGTTTLHLDQSTLVPAVVFLYDPYRRIVVQHFAASEVLCFTDDTVLSSRLVLSRRRILQLSSEKYNYITIDCDGHEVHFADAGTPIVLIDSGLTARFINGRIFLYDNPVEHYVAAGNGGYMIISEEENAIVRSDAEVPVTAWETRSLADSATSFDIRSGFEIVLPEVSTGPLLSPPLPQALQALQPQPQPQHPRQGSSRSVVLTMALNCNYASKVEMGIGSEKGFVSVDRLQADCKYYVTDEPGERSAHGDSSVDFSNIVSRWSMLLEVEGTTEMGPSNAAAAGTAATAASAAAGNAGANNNNSATASPPPATHVFLRRVVRCVAREEVQVRVRHGDVEMAALALRTAAKALSAVEANVIPAVQDPDDLTNARARNSGAVVENKDVTTVELTFPSIDFTFVDDSRGDVDLPFVHIQVSRLSTPTLVLTTQYMAAHVNLTLRADYYHVDSGAWLPLLDPVETDLVGKHVYNLTLEDVQRRKGDLRVGVRMQRQATVLHVTPMGARALMHVANLSNSLMSSADPPPPQQQQQQASVSAVSSAAATSPATQTATPTSVTPPTAGLPPAPLASSAAAAAAATQRSFFLYSLQQHVAPMIKVSFPRFRGARAMTIRQDSDTMVPDRPLLPSHQGELSSRPVNLPNGKSVHFNFPRTDGHELPVANHQLLLSVPSSFTDDKGRTRDGGSEAAEDADDEPAYCDLESVAVSIGKVGVFPVPHQLGLGNAILEVLLRDGRKHVVLRTNVSFVNLLPFPLKLDGLHKIIPAGETLAVNADAMRKRCVLRPLPPLPPAMAAAVAAAAAMAAASAKKNSSRRPSGTAGGPTRGTTSELFAASASAVDPLSETSATTSIDGSPVLECNSASLGVHYESLPFLYDQTYVCACPVSKMDDSPVPRTTYFFVRFGPRVLLSQKPYVLDCRATFEAPFSIVNNTGAPLQLALYYRLDGRSNERRASFIPSRLIKFGQSEYYHPVASVDVPVDGAVPITQADPELAVYMDVTVLQPTGSLLARAGGSGSHPALVRSPQHKGRASCLMVYDQHGQPLVLRIEYTDRTISLSCPYWIVNQTAHYLQFADRTPRGPSPVLCSGQAVDGLQANTMPFLLCTDRLYYHNQKKAHIYVRVGRYGANGALSWTSWSDKLYIDTMGSIFVGTCDSSEGEAFTFSYSVDLVGGALKDTRVIKFTPRWIVINRCGRSISVSQNTLRQSHVVNLTPRHSSTIDTCRVDDENTLAIKFCDDDEITSSQWSERFCIDRFAAHALNMCHRPRKDMTRLEFSVVRVSCYTRDSILYVAVDKSEKPPFIIENRTRYTVSVKQRGTARELHVYSRTTKGFVWENAKADPVIVVGVYETQKHRTQVFCVLNLAPEIVMKARHVLAQDVVLPGGVVVYIRARAQHGNYAISVTTDTLIDRSRRCPYDQFSLRLHLQTVNVVMGLTGNVKDDVVLISVGDPKGVPALSATVSQGRSPTTDDDEQSLEVKLGAVQVDDERPSAVKGVVVQVTPSELVMVRRMDRSTPVVQLVRCEAILRPVTIHLEDTFLFEVIKVLEAVGQSLGKQQNVSRCVFANTPWVDELENMNGLDERNLLWRSVFIDKLFIEQILISISLYRGRDVARDPLREQLGWLSLLIRSVQDARFDWRRIENPNLSDKIWLLLTFLRNYYMLELQHQLLNVVHVAGLDSMRNIVTDLLEGYFSASSGPHIDRTQQLVRRRQDARYATTLGQPAIGAQDFVDVADESDLVADLAADCRCRTIERLKRKGLFSRAQVSLAEYAHHTTWDEFVAGITPEELRDYGLLAVCFYIRLRSLTVMPPRPACRRCEYVEGLRAERLSSDSTSSPLPHPSGQLIGWSELCHHVSWVEFVSICSLQEIRQHAAAVRDSLLGEPHNVRRVDARLLWILYENQGQTPEAS